MIEEYIHQIMEAASHSQSPTQEDYTGLRDGLLYCGKCNTPRQCKINILGTEKTVGCLCQCRAIEQKVAELERKEREKFDCIQRLKAFSLQDTSCFDHTFNRDNGKCHQMDKAHSYVNQWHEMHKENIGLLLWGGVGTGKTFFAGCIANALLEQFVPVCITNFSRVLNSLSGLYSEEKNRFIAELDRFRLLVLDDFGMERQTEYALEQVFHVVDARYKNGQPLIITTNLTLKELQNPTDTAHERIYSRILEMCRPIRFVGEDMRKGRADEKMQTARKLLLGE